MLKMQRECSFAPTAKQCQGDDKRFDKKTDSGVNKLNKIAQRVLDLANGIPCKRQCRAMASEYIRGLVIGRLRNCLMLQREYSIEPTENPVRDSVGRWQVSICVDC